MACIFLRYQPFQTAHHLSLPCRPSQQRRATDPIADAERKAKQDRLFALNVPKIMNGEDQRTTLMVKNIPNKYTQKMLLATLDEHFKVSGRAALNRAGWQRHTNQCF